MLRRSFFQVTAAAVDVTRFHTPRDGSALATRALQAAIDEAARTGGTVYLPPGRYLSGTLFLRSHVRLHLDAGATLLGSTNLADYPVTVAQFRSYTDNYTDKSLLYAENLADIGITGAGALDGQGAAFKGPYKVRPYMIRVIGCRGVAVEGVAIRNSPMWVQHYLNCDSVAIRGITVESRVNANNDGIDIDCCARVRISDCDISSGDDAIVLKSTAARKCSAVTVSNCTLSSACNALKLGTETNGGFEDIAFSNCVIYDTRLAGLALEIVDGGTLERVVASGITMRDVGAPLFIRLGDRARPFVEGQPRPPLGALRGVQISNVQGTATQKTGCAIAGLPGHPVEDVWLENIRLQFPGGGTAADARRVPPEEAEKYPEYKMFGTLPAFGLYCRHVRGLRTRGLALSTATPDARPAVAHEDVTGD